MIHRIRILSEESEREREIGGGGMNWEEYRFLEEHTNYLSLYITIDIDDNMVPSYPTLYVLEILFC